MANKRTYHKPGTPHKPQPVAPPKPQTDIREMSEWRRLTPQQQHELAGALQRGHIHIDVLRGQGWPSLEQVKLHGRLTSQIYLITEILRQVFLKIAMSQEKALGTNTGILQALARMHNVPLGDREFMYNIFKTTYGLAHDHTLFGHTTSPLTAKQLLEVRQRAELLIESHRMNGELVDLEYKVAVELGSVPQKITERTGEALAAAYGWVRPGVIPISLDDCVKKNTEDILLAAIRSGVPEQRNHPHLLLALHPSSQLDQTVLERWDNSPKLTYHGRPAAAGSITHGPQIQELIGAGLVEPVIPNSETGQYLKTDLKMVKYELTPLGMQVVSGEVPSGRFSMAWGKLTPDEQEAVASFWGVTGEGISKPLATLASMAAATDNARLTAIVPEWDQRPRVRVPNPAQRGDGNHKLATIAHAKLADYMYDQTTPYGEADLLLSDAAEGNLRRYHTTVGPGGNNGT